MKTAFPKIPLDKITALLHPPAKGKHRPAPAPMAGRRAKSGGIKETLDKLAFNWKVRQALYRHMIVQIENDIGEIAALELFAKRLQRQGRKSCGPIAQDMIRRMKNGERLPAAIAAWVPQDEALIIMGGDKAGRITESFALVIDSKNRTTSVRRTAMAAFRTPMIYLAALCGMVWAIGYFFLPGVSQAMPKGHAQGAAAYLMSIGGYAASWAALLPFGVILAAIGWLVWALPNWTSPYRIQAEKYFPFDFYRDIQGYTWLITYAAMLRAGIPAVPILDEQLKAAPKYLKQRLTNIRRRMLNGEELGNALIQSGYGFPNPDLIDDISSSAGFKDFPARIMKRANQWADDMERETKDKMTKLGATFNVIMYGVIAFVLFAINSMSTQMGNIPGM